ncbi:MAG: Penicillin-binding protein 2 [Chlamydiae bacterium]|nr:Penicillin-binding protein 2 [Chlamydiota bacterium]
MWNEGRREGDVPEKANRILNGILGVLFLIFLRVWHLAVFQHEEKIEEARRPQERTVIERAPRATITDRFGVPLAINKVQYNAAVRYGPIREMPRWIWKKNKSGKREKFFYRKEYIQRLAQVLGEELQLDARDVEDQIHGKAAILGNVPCVLKENITEQEYFRLQMLGMSWPGVQAEVAPKRCYPKGAVAGEILGYIGPISREEYDAITQELEELRSCITIWEEGEEPPFPVGCPTMERVEARVKELEKKAYSYQDWVGKMGVEATFDEQLRGSSGKKRYLTDTRGNFLQQMPGSVEATPGNRIVLSISSELQAYAEQLLIEYDGRPPSQRAGAVALRKLLPENQPWIKGGAAIVMNPQNGEIYAMASSPRFNPNDFIRVGQGEERDELNQRVHRWMETEGHISQLWDQKVPFKRERFSLTRGEYYDEEVELTWETYLQFILPPNSPVREVLEANGSVGDALFVQRSFEKLCSLFASDELKLTSSHVLDFLLVDEETIPVGVTTTLPQKAFLEERFAEVEGEVATFQEVLAPYFTPLKRNYEKLLLVDLYRVVVDERRFSPTLTQLIGHLSLNEYREAMTAFVGVEEAICKIVRDLFHEHDFRLWREEFFADFLANKRKEEKKALVKYPKPYLYYLEKEERRQFELFWEENKWGFLTMFLQGEEEGVEDPYQQTLAAWSEELDSGAHKALAFSKAYLRLQERMQEIPPLAYFSILQSFRSYSELDRPLLGRYGILKGNEEKHLAAGFYPKYGFGYARSYAFRQATTIGSIFKLIPSYEALVQLFDKGKDLNPFVIIDDKHRTQKGWNVGYQIEGQPIPMYYHGGRIPRSEHSGVGKIDLVRAIETSSNPYFALLSGEILDDPEDLCRAAALFGYGEKSGIDLPGEYKGYIPQDVSYNRSGLYAMSMGQHSLLGTPLQTATMMAAMTNGGAILKPQILKEQLPPQGVQTTTAEPRWQVYLPTQVQQILIEGLKQVVRGEKGTARSLRQLYPSIAETLIGKTSTSEIMERFSLDGAHPYVKTKPIWFGGISYTSTELQTPELVILIYLRQGEFGRDATPFACKLLEKARSLHLPSK